MLPTAVHANAAEQSPTLTLSESPWYCKMMKTPKRTDNFSQWYHHVITASDLCDTSPSRGCMIFKPWGFAVWERIKQAFDIAFQQHGVENAYFPLLIPLDLMEKEAEFVEGFAKECAVVTHTRLQKNAQGVLEPASPLERPYIIRPTSETIIGEAFARWIKSYRDLPLKINQWANVMRWEMRTRPFLRTTEILWQEGHTAYATEQEAQNCAQTMATVYHQVTRAMLALPLFLGEKSCRERFPGATTTWTIEGIMQDGKALQCGTSHYLGQTFSKAANICFNTKEGETAFAYTSSWGVTARLIGAMVMTHGDDDGIVLPPTLAPQQIVIVPLLKKSVDHNALRAYVQALHAQLATIRWNDAPLRILIDTSDLTPGEKRWKWVKRGVPLLIEVGDKDLEKGMICWRNRLTHNDKVFETPHSFVAKVAQVLSHLQQQLLENATQKRDAKVKTVTTLEAFEKSLQDGTVVRAPCTDQPEKEDYYQQKVGFTHRLFMEESTEPCIFQGSGPTRWALFAKAY